MSSAHLALAVYAPGAPGVRSRLFELLGVRLKAKKTDSEVDAEFREKMQGKLGNPALVVVSQLLSDDPHRREEDYAARACAIQNLCLSACGWLPQQVVHGGLTTHAETYQLMGIEASRERIVGFVWIGRPGKMPVAPKRPRRRAHSPLGLKPR